MTNLVSEADAATKDIPADNPSRSLRNLRAKRDAPEWVQTAKNADLAVVWKHLRAELPRPLKSEGSLPRERTARFPMLGTATTQAEALFSEQSRVTAISTVDDAERLRMLVVLLDGLGRGEHPQHEEALEDLWWWVWNESRRFDAPTSRFDDSLSRMLHAEALMAGGLFFAGISGMRARFKSGRQRLWEELETQTDSDGVPRAELLDVMPAWIAAVVRSGTWAGASGIKWAKPRELERCDGLFRSVAALLRADHTCCLSNNETLAAWLLAGGQLRNWKKSDPIARFLSRFSKGGASENGKSTRRRAGGTTFQSEWAKLMASRSGWDASADLVALRHDGIQPGLEWHVAGDMVMTGEWGLEVRLDGEPVELTAEWDAVSWFEDREVVYLELQWSGMPELVVCRQLLFTRGDQQLWLADAVSTPARPETQIEVTTRWALADGWEIEQRRPTRELRLNRARGQSIRCVPLSFPMEGTQEGPGVIRAGGGEIQIRQTGRGGAYCPLLFDWHAPRKKAAVDWRALTVTEDGRRLGAPEAAAARVRIGPQQWMIYRNLNGSTAMRAVIGYHHNQESVIGHFTRDGEVDPLVMVEAADESEI